MPQVDRSAFDGKEIERIFVGTSMSECSKAEAVLSAVAIDYLVEVEPIQVGLFSLDPLRLWPIILGFIDFFVLRNIHRHLFSAELYSGFGVSPLVNNLTTIFFGLQALLLAFLWWLAQKPAARANDLIDRVSQYRN